MKFVAGHKKVGGRRKGTPNTRTSTVEEIASRYAVDPFDVLMMFVVGDWQALGYKDASEIKVSDRIQAAKDACKYLYPAKQSVAVTGASDAEFRIIVQDYTAK